ncbi:hypothetical protein SRHO_G00137760 [Serrasalmus rhombeus]
MFSTVVTYFLIQWFIGISTSLTVEQSPANLFLLPKEALNITCSHHDKSYDKIYWYRHVKQDLELLGFLSFTNPQIDRKDFNLSGDAEKEGFLTASSVTAEHSALYFCAVSAAQCCKYIEAYDENPSYII